MHAFDDLINQVQNNQKELIEKITKGQVFKNFKNMKFNAIVGNPPYQETGDNNNRSLPIYNHFVDLAKQLNPHYISMIMPSRWFTSSILQGDFTQRMINDTTISKMVDFSEATECFPSVEIKGGICYLLFDSSHDGPCDIIISHRGSRTHSTRYLKNKYGNSYVRYDEGLNILEKINISEINSFASIVSAQNPFGFNSKVVGDKKQQDGKIKIISKFRTIGFINRNLVTLRESMIDQWKIMTPIAGEGGALPHRVTGRPFVSCPGECCNGTYMVIGPFETKEDSYAALNYLYTKFARFLVSLAQYTQNTKSESYQFVPLQDFTSHSDIDWSKSIPDIDQQLYRKYNLSPDETAFIEKMIKPME